MKMAEARSIIKGKVKGYIVDFEWVDRGMLSSDHFPEPREGEPLIETEAEAWELARSFAKKTFGKCVNIYVIDQDYAPVRGYKDKKILNR